MGYVRGEDEGIDFLVTGKKESTVLAEAAIRNNENDIVQQAYGNHDFRKRAEIKKKM